MSLKDRVKHLLKILGHALGLSLHDRLSHTDRQLNVVIEQNNALARTLTALLQGAIHLSRSQKGGRIQLGNVGKDAPGTIVLETRGSDSEPVDPETALVEFLYSYLPSRTILNIEAGGPDRSGPLLATGYKIFTPDDPSIPDEIDLLTAPGSELVDALQKCSSPVVHARLGDTIPTALEPLVKQMQDRDYAWHITIFGIRGNDGTAFLTNMVRPVPDSYGSVFFFRSFELFQTAHGWCEAVLPRAYSQPAQSS